MSERSDDDYYSASAPGSYYTEDGDGSAYNESQRSSFHKPPKSTRRGTAAPHPSTTLSPGDVITVNVGKSTPKQDPGLKVEEINGKYYVRKVSGLCSQTPLVVGDKILQLNGIDSREFDDLRQLKKILKEEPRITVVVVRRDPDASVSSADSSDDEDEDDE